MSMTVPMSQTTTLHADEEAVRKVEQAPNSDTKTASPSVPPSSDCAWQDKPLKYPGKGTHADPYVVDWDLADPENPFNWSSRRRWAITFQVGLSFGTVPVAAAGSIVGILWERY